MRSQPAAAARASRSDALPAVDPVERAGNVDEALRIRVEALARGETARPVGGGATAPGVRRLAQDLAGSAAIALRDEIIERAVHVPQGRAAFSAVEGGGDDGVAAGLQAP